MQINPDRPSNRNCRQSIAYVEIPGQQKVQIHGLLIDITLLKAESNRFICGKFQKIICVFIVSVYHVGALGCPEQFSLCLFIIFKTAVGFNVLGR